MYVLLLSACALIMYGEQRAERYTIHPCALPITPGARPPKKNNRRKDRENRTGGTHCNVICHAPLHTPGGLLSPLPGRRMKSK